MPRRKKDDPLTFKEKKFVTTYIKNKGNGAQAALTAYDVSKEQAGNLAHQILNKPVVKEEVSKQLDKAGLSLQTLHDYSFTAINDNLKHGKYSQSAGISHLQFLYKLHNAVPANKKMNMNLSLKRNVANQDMKELQDNLQKLTDSTNSLLALLK